MYLFNATGDLVHTLTENGREDVVYNGLADMTYEGERLDERGASGMNTRVRGLGSEVRGGRLETSLKKV